jgi:hypothetical protein
MKSALERRALTDAIRTNNRERLAYEQKVEQTSFEQAVERLLLEARAEIEAADGETSYVYFWGRYDYEPTPKSTIDVAWSRFEPELAELGFRTARETKSHDDGGYEKVWRTIYRVDW